MTLEALLARRDLMLSVLLDGLGERDRRDAAQGEWGFALQLQTDGLPGGDPAFPDHPEIDIRAGMMTAAQVGGDIYDYFLLDERRLAMVVADASGKGLPAAVTITRMRTLLRAAARRVPDPAACMAVINEILCFDNPDLMFVTAFYAVLDTADGTLHFVNAGHNPPMLVDDGAVRPIGGESDLVLGVMDDAPYRTQRLQLRPGATLCCFSDGVTEAHDGDGALFGEQRLSAALAASGGQALAEMEAAVLGAVDAFIGMSPVADDLTLLLLRWNGQSAPAKTA